MLAILILCLDPLSMPELLLLIFPMFISVFSTRKSISCLFPVLTSFFSFPILVHWSVILPLVWFCLSYFLWFFISIFCWVFHFNPSIYLPRMSRIYSLLVLVLCPSSFWKILLSFIVLSLYLYLSFFTIFPLSLSCHNSLVIIKSFSLLRLLRLLK